MPQTRTLTRLLLFLLFLLVDDCASLVASKASLGLLDVERTWASRFLGLLAFGAILILVWYSEGRGRRAL